MPKTPDYFAGKTIIITGAGSGIGRATALIFAREKANVVCADINESGVKEMIYVAVSVTNGCAYCIATHTEAARRAGMSEAMFGELMAVVGMANETNRLANGYRVPIDDALKI